MKLTITGANVRYTIEQLAQTLFAGKNLTAECTVSQGKTRVSASCILALDGISSKSYSWADLPDNEYDLHHVERLTAARAFYKSSLKLLDGKPEWGMLSGVRPAKLIRARLASGDTPEQAQHFLEHTYFVSPEKAKLCMIAGNEAYKAEQSLKKHDVFLYIHIPFCPSRCSYCSFVSMSAGDFSRYGDAYFNALFSELDAFLSLAQEIPLNVRAVYIGGGTPAILDAAQLSSLCLRVRTAAPDVEFTVEAGRPDAITIDKLKAMKDACVSRICVNTQTIHDKTLELIGRKHTGKDFFTAYSLAEKVGFNNINVDLIAGLPDESVQDFSDSLNSVISLGSKNITVHTLAVKRSSFLNELNYKNSSPSVLREMLNYTADTLTSYGFSPYYLYRQKNMGGSFENIGYTLPGSACLYNICMMEEIGDVIAIGAGASSKLTADGIKRRINPKYPKEYIESVDDVLKSFDEIRRYFNDQ